MRKSRLFLYTVIASSHYTQAVTMGLRFKLDQAKRLAESFELDRWFDWHDFPNGAFVEGGFPDGPRYSYSIEQIEVKIV